MTYTCTYWVLIVCVSDLFQPTTWSGALIPGYWDHYSPGPRHYPSPSSPTHHHPHHPHLSPLHLGTHHFHNPHPHSHSHSSTLPHTHPPHSHPHSAPPIPYLIGWSPKCFVSPSLSSFDPSTSFLYPRSASQSDIRHLHSVGLCLPTKCTGNDVTVFSDSVHHNNHRFSLPLSPPLFLPSPSPPPSPCSPPPPPLFLPSPPSPSPSPSSSSSPRSPPDFQVEGAHAQHTEGHGEFCGSVGGKSQDQWDFEQGRIDYTGEHRFEELIQKTLNTNMD